MSKLLIPYGVVTVTFLVIDAIWLGLVATSFYKNQLGPLMLERPKFAIALVFYLMYALAITILALQPALAANSWQTALFYGAVLGFAAYGTYDVTNMATLKNWPVTMSIVDWIWGTVLTGVVTAISFFIVRSMVP